MVRALEAVIRNGQISPLEPVEFVEDERLVILRWPNERPVNLQADVSSHHDWRRFAGSLKDSQHWNGDPLLLQEAMRGEWH